MQRLIYILLVLFFVSCGSPDNTDDRPRVTVSIAPLGFLVEQLADTLVQVDVLVPQTTSPESYDPTVRQLQALAQSDLYFAVGLIDFESALESRVLEVAPNIQYVDLSQGIDILAGVCSHSHGDHSDHNHGVDPHIWLSPLNMIRMAESVCTSLSRSYPEWQQQFHQNLSVLRGRILEFDYKIKSQIDSTHTHSFAIVHPSLTYLARDYGLTQLAIEFEGKEPSAGQLTRLVDQLREAGVTKILYARQDSDAAAQAIATELNLEMVEYDPLHSQWLENLYFMKDLICN